MNSNFISFFKKFSGPEIFVILVLLILGVASSLTVPLSAGYDEETHFIRAWEMAHYYFIPNEQLGAKLPFPALYWELSYRRQPLVEAIFASYGHLQIDGKAMGWGGDGSGRMPSGAPDVCTAWGAPARPVEVMLERDPPRSRAIQVLNMSPVVPEVTSRQLGEVGIVAFNVFLLQPVLGEVQKAIDGFRARGAKAIIIDLRGNPGGIGAMVIPLAARLSATPLTLGTIVYRDFSNTLVTTASLGIKPFAGRVVILADEGTASTSEILAAGLQEAKRALVVGDTTAGAALGSIIEELPGGAVVQIPVADFKTPKGVSIEGRGVQPDRRVFETRAGFVAGSDVVLDAGLDLAKASHP